jgi:hypothetical protein
MKQESIYLVPHRFKAESVTAVHYELVTPTARKSDKNILCKDERWFQTQRLFVVHDYYTCQGPSTTCDGLSLKYIHITPGVSSPGLELPDVLYRSAQAKITRCKCDTRGFTTATSLTERDLSDSTSNTRLYGCMPTRALGCSTQRNSLYANTLPLD